MSPTNYGLLGITKEATTNAYFRKLDILADVPIMMTTSLDNDVGIVGNFRRLILGVRTNVRIALLRELYAGNLQYGLLCYLRMDVTLEHATSFCKTSNLTTS